MAFTAIECTPSELMEKYSCLACISEQQLLAVIALSLAQMNATYASDVNQLLEDSACYNCLSEKQQLQAIAALLANMAFSDSSVAEVIDKIKCLLCATPAQLRAAILFIICTNYQLEINTDGWQNVRQ